MLIFVKKKSYKILKNLYSTRHVSCVGWHFQMFIRQNVSFYLLRLIRILYVFNVTGCSEKIQTLMVYDPK